MAEPLSACRTKQDCLIGVLPQVLEENEQRDIRIVSISFDS
ncbi:hypothetical protein MMEU_4219 [Mycobacterium marinum str. Europe]|nr:hypothetical protein MMEU_4219 [Mycobacterium marinum str. Europe]